MRIFLPSVPSVARRSPISSPWCEGTGHEAYALRLLSEFHTHRDPPEVEAAETHYGRGRASAERGGLTPLDRVHGVTPLGTHRLDQLNAKLLSGVPTQHARHEGFRDVGLGE